MKNTIKKCFVAIMVIGISSMINLCLSQGGTDGFFGGLQNESIYNHSIGDAISPIETENGNNSTSILHMGSKRIFGLGEGEQIEGIVGSDEQIVSYDIALTRVLTVIQNVVNYTLGLIGVIALVYLLIHGFMILTAGGDDGKTKKGLKGIKNAFIAIVGIGLSWIMISFILRLINTFTS